MSVRHDNPWGDLDDENAADSSAIGLLTERHTYLRLTAGGRRLLSAAFAALRLFVETAANKTYTFDLSARVPYTINSLTAAVLSGTISAKVQIGGVDVTGLTGVGVTSVPATTAATGANTVAVGQRVTLVTSANAVALDLAAALNITYS